MNKITFRYGDGRTLQCSYEELSVPGTIGKKPMWNHEALLLYAEPLRPVEILCGCRDDITVPMHVVENPIGSHRYHLRTNRGRSELHDPSCLKHALDAPAKVIEAANANSAVQFHPNAKGETVVEVSISLFAGGIREDAGDERVDIQNDVEQTRPTRTIVEEVEDAEGTTSRRAKAKFGGLIREWYLVGREFALANAARPGYLNRRDVVHGMWRTLIMDRVCLGSGDSLKPTAYVPHKTQTDHQNGDRKVLLGLLRGVENAEDSGREVRLHIQGINDVWTVEVPEPLTKKATDIKEQMLVGVRVRRRGDTWRLTHAPFAVPLANPDAMWVESGLEAEAYGALSRTRFGVDKPLRVMDEVGGLRPDFVLTGLDKPVMVEVYGRVGDPSYDEHKETKQTMYRTHEREGLLYYLEWDLTEKDSREAFLSGLRALESRL